MSKTKIQWTDEEVDRSIKSAATRLGISTKEYLDKINNGYKWCTSCGRWLDRNLFHKDKSRGDGLKSKCKECSKALWRRKAIFNNTKRQERRSGDMKQARSRINSDVEMGIRPNPNDLYCAICGHKGDDKRHEYHHHMGYEAEHHYDVLPVCVNCHKNIEGGKI
jgi:hypothetical protein